MGTTYKHLSCEERTMIQLSLEQDCTLRAIARSVQRAPSLVWRELKRNDWSNPALASKKRGRPLVAGGYRAPLAQQRADKGAGMARGPSRLAMEGPLWGSVECFLRDRHLPEAVVGTLRRMNPGQPSLQARHETRYTALCAMPRGTLRTELMACLHQARKSRRPRARGEDCRGVIPHMARIPQRPPEIDERIIPGYWEGDLITGARNASSMGSLVERATLFVTLAKRKDATADSAVTALGSALNRIDAQQRLSMTCDQGRERAKHERLSDITGGTVCFADPHSPWPRGINENTKGLLRPIFPQGLRFLRALSSRTRCRSLAAQYPATKKPQLERPSRILDAGSL